MRPTPMSPEVGKLAEPWKKGDLKGKMMLMRLRVSLKETPKQLALFGWNTVQRELIPPEMDRAHFFPQYVPVRERCTTPEFCVTWVPKVREFRKLPDAVKADPPPLTTGKGCCVATSEKELADPLNLARGLVWELRKHGACRR